MNPLQIPEELKGPWEHLLILTYGADLPFLENGLWRQFSSRCRNKIILADGQHFLEACEQYAQDGLVRHLNQQYVAEGIFTAHSAHAKLILLTNPDCGRLLVGSGNLGLQGYASGGELFSKYEYQAENSDQPEMLNPFLAVWEFVQTLVERGYIISHSVRKRLDYLFEQTPWLYHKSVGEWQPVRHNLDVSFLDQLKQLVGNEAVQELWILAPFYDKEAIALTKMVETLRPRQVTLLVQPGCTSVDPQVLQQRLHQLSNCQVRAATLKDHQAYIHAKLYLLKLSKRAICLQGSPNLSQMAMLRPAAQGNIELANLLSGPPTAFDDLLQALQIEPPTVQLDTLNLKYVASDRSTGRRTGEWQLTGGEWHEDWLDITYQGMLPNLQGAALMVARRSFPLDLRHQEVGRLTIKLSKEIIGWLSRPVPIAIRWGGGDGTQTSNPIFICNRGELNNVLRGIPEGDGDKLPRFGDLDLEDEEFEQLLAELDAALMIDRRSVWQMAGRAVPATSNDNDDQLHLSYGNINYEMLRQHPRIVQYTRRGSGERSIHSRLQIILNAITDHFRGLLDISKRKQLVTQIIDSGAETEEEREQEEEEGQGRRWSAIQRLQRILKNFIQRYLRGLHSPDFQELAGFEVIAQNYIIFSHLLVRLFTKNWVDYDFIIGALTQTWVFFWGNEINTGYYHTLTKEEQHEVLKWVYEHHANAELLAALAYSAYWVNGEGWDDVRFALRDFWRQMLHQMPFELTTQTVKEAWRILANLNPYESPLPMGIVTELVNLAIFETRYSFLRGLETKYGYRPHSCFFEEVIVRRPSVAREVAVDCLVLGSKTALVDMKAAIDVLKQWMRFQDLSYYRLAAPDPNGSAKVLYYEVSQESGIYWARDHDEDPVDFGPIALEPLDWQVALFKLKDLAVQLEAELVLAPVGASATSSRRNKV